MVGEKDEVRGVPGRTTRVGKPALVDQDDLFPTLFRQGGGHAIAHDPGTDYDDARPRRHRTQAHPSLGLRPPAHSITRKTKSEKPLAQRTRATTFSMSERRPRAPTPLRTSPRSFPRRPRPILTTVPSTSLPPSALGY